MKVCVIGAGPAGLYTSRYLLNNGIKVTAYEKENKIYGHLRCSFFNRYDPKIFNDVITHKYFNLKLNKNVFEGVGGLKNLESRYDAFVVATGSGAPNSNYKSMSIACEDDLYDKNKYCGNNIICENHDNIDCKGLQAKVSESSCVMSFLKNRLSDFRNIIKNSRMNLKCTENKKNMLKTTDSNIIKPDNVNSGYKNNFLCDGKPITIPNKNKFINAIDVTRFYNGCGLNKPDIGKNVLIIGCGNVALDVIKFLLTKDKNVQNITITCRKDMMNSAFTNIEARSVFELNDVAIKTNLDDKSIQKDMQSRMKVTEESKTSIRRRNIFKRETNGNRTINFLFNTDIMDVKNSDDKHFVEMCSNGVKKTDVYDTVILSIGFQKSDIKIPVNIKKPAYYVGWAKNPTGNLDDIEKDAFETAQKIFTDLKEKTIKKQRV